MDTNHNLYFASVLHVFILSLQLCWVGRFITIKRNILTKVLVKVLSNANMHGKCACRKKK